jgi:hypothetical protein
MVAVFGRMHWPVASLLYAFLLLTGLFAVAGAGFGLVASLTSASRRPHSPL